MCSLCLSLWLWTLHLHHVIVMVSTNVLLWLDDHWLRLGWERLSVGVKKTTAGKLAVKGEISIEYLQMQAKQSGKSRRLMRSLTRSIINIYLIKENGQRGTKKNRHRDNQKAPPQTHKTLSLHSSRHICLPLPNKSVSFRKATAKNWVLNWSKQSFIVWDWKPDVLNPCREQNQLRPIMNVTP